MTTASQKWPSDVKTFDAEKLPPHQKKKNQMPSQSEKHRFYPILDTDGQNQTKTA